MLKNKLIYGAENVTFLRNLELFWFKFSQKLAIEEGQRLLQGVPCSYGRGHIPWFGRKLTYVKLTFFKLFSAVLSGSL